MLKAAKNGKTTTTIKEEKKKKKVCKKKEKKFKVLFFKTRITINHWKKKLTA